MFSALRPAIAFVIIATLPPLRAAESPAGPDTRKKVVMLIAEPEYDTARTLPDFASKFLSDEFRVVVVPGTVGQNEHGFEGIEAVRDADLLLVSMRRRTPPRSQLELIRAHVRAGKPVVGIRTASHAFSPLRGRAIPTDGDAWPEWDAQVIGGNYTGHHGSGPEHMIEGIPDFQPPPTLSGIRLPFRSRGPRVARSISPPSSGHVTTGSRLVQNRISAAE